MSVKTIPSLPIKKLRDVFGESLQENVTMSSYTTARVGGRVDGLVVVHGALELEKTVQLLWDLNVPFYVIGGGSNVLAPDAGLRGVVVLNRAHTVKIDTTHNTPAVWAESGAIFSSIAHQVALRGLSGLEWAATIPGTVGGAIYGNAGAFGSDMSSTLILAEILQPSGKITWTTEEMAFAYRSSRLKRNHEPAVILSAKLKLSQSTTEAVQAQMDAFSAKRRGSQPPGASMGSIFKNPPGDYAGRLIEAAGLKGTKIGGAEVSSVHANFFINRENATAADLYQLIRLVQSKVMETSQVMLELEVELLGNWQDQA
jgi:UDP-N-acetylmuramate dehydrogenase